MPRSFDLSTASPDSVERTLEAYRDEEYWLARLADFGSGTATLDSMDVDADGTVRVALTASLFGGHLPSRVRPFHHGDLRFAYTETWSPISGGQSRGLAGVAVPGVPLSAQGVLLLAPTSTGSRLQYSATVEVRVPIIGGTIESVIGGRLADGVVAIQHFTTEWIAANR